ncbi:MAG: AMP-binding protein [Deltaproteobacteria bacterium]|nr:AMP-binding protein [Deltaproteobacteria bacterium]
MAKSNWMHMGTALKMNATNYPDKLGWQDKSKEFTFKQWNDRSCRLTNGLHRIGVGQKDRFAVLAYNRGEWMDIYAGAAKGGQIVVPLMFRLAGPDIEFIVNHSECKGMIVEAPFVDLINGSGTTGRPKGVVRSHESYIADYYLNNINMGVRNTDKVMLVMPMCHVNSIFYSFPYTLITAPVFVYNMVSFDPEDLLKTIAEYKITFTSLVPTHYIMILALPDEIKNNLDVSSIRQLLISSAPARKDLKMAIMDYFKNAELWEAYGSTEGGLVTLLRPEDQFKKLGSIGREIFGTDRIRILDEKRQPVPDGEVGELFYRTPMLFTEYWKEPEKTKEAFDNGWSSAGDMVRRDEDGYYVLVDRKANMIITGGENVYPSEVENIVGSHPAVKDVAVIGVPDKKWGEAIKAIVILHEGFKGTSALAKEIIDYCQGKIAAFKKPKTIDFITDAEMPRTGTGKILHRILREKYGKWSD